MFALADCNNFFVSCERVFRPDLNGKPVIVLSNNDGCAIARSNEAKALGIKMGDPLFKIRDLVRQHQVTVFSGNMALYGDLSQRVRWVLQEFSPSIEVYSIDEAFLNLQGLRVEDFDGYAKEISRRCYKHTGIPVSVGIAPTKTLAKIASRLCKQYSRLKGGCYMHRPEDIEKVLRKLPIEEVWGIGRKSSRKLHDRGIWTAQAFIGMPMNQVRQLFGVTGVRTWLELQGTPCIQFEDTLPEKQSICVSRSFSSEIFDRTELTQQVANFAAEATRKLRGQDSLCTEMAVFAYTNRFKEDAPQACHSTLIHFPEATAEYRPILAAAVNALQEIHQQGYGYKKAGVVITRLLSNKDYRSLPGNLFDQDSQCSETGACHDQRQERDQQLSELMEDLQRTYGRDIIRFGTQGDGHIKNTHDNRSPHYTTRWEDIPKVNL